MKATHEMICNNFQMIVTKRKNSDDRFCARYQCLTCGFTIPTSIKMPKEDNLPFFDEIKATEAKDKLNKISINNYEESKQRDHEKRVLDYNDYLKSKEWYAKRGERLFIDNYRCAMCGTTHHLHVHHKTYINLKNENVQDDLITVCNRCHEKIHNLILYKWS